MRSLACLILSTGLLSSAYGADWPRFRGPDADGVSKEKNWLGAWPAGQPKQVWKNAVGAGFSGMVVAGNRLFTTGHDGQKSKGNDSVLCLDSMSGKELWRYSYPQPLADHYYEGGTSATPTLDGDRLYTVSKSGRVLCLNASTGELVWQQELSSNLGAKTPEWGFAGAPYIHKGLVIFNAGDAGVGLDKTTGKKVWLNGQGPSGYGTPVPFQIGNQQALALFSFRHVIAIEPGTGRELWRHPWKTKYDVNAADPVISGDIMLLTSGYGTGATAIRFTDSSATELWKHKLLRAHMQSPVVLEGRVYGLDGDGGDGDSRLKCFDLATGRLHWESSKAETGALSAADGKILWLTGRGELVVVKGSPDKYEEIARAQVSGGKFWTAPVLSNGRLYIRNWKGELLCLDLRGSGNVS